MVRVATLSKAEAPLRHTAVKEGLDYLHDRLLHDAVSYHWNAQRTPFLRVGRFGNVHPAHWLRDETLLHELALNLSQVRFTIRFKCADRDPVETVSVELWDKLKALELLGKHVGLFHDNGVGEPVTGQPAVSINIQLPPGIMN